MHHFLLILFAIGFAYVMPLRVVAVTFISIFLVSLTIKTLTRVVSRQVVGYFTCLTAVALSIFFFLIAGFFFGSVFSPSQQGFTFLLMGGPAFMLVPVGLFAAYMLGFHLVLPTTLSESAVVAIASSVISVLIIYLLRVALL